jgi:oxygen-independent coproporphyrinogen-3 oxidase
MYGIPGQSKEQWEQNLAALVALEPDHISCYALTIEEKTTFGNWQKKGKIHALKDEIVAEQYDIMVSYLTSNGYEHYEVSNFSKPNNNSKHNSAYWHQKPYLGLGPGAHSFNGSERHFNISNNPSYIRLISQKNQAFTKESLNNIELVTEYILTRIRTKWGVDFDAISSQFDYKLSKDQLSYIQMIVSKKLATFAHNKLVLNSKGFFISDTVAVKLIPDL